MSLKADIFSLGVIIKDIVTGRKEDIDRKNVRIVLTPISY